MPKVTQLGRGRAQIQTTTAQLWTTHRPVIPFPVPIEPPGIPPGGRQSWGGVTAAETPVHTGPAGQRDQPPNAMFLPWWAGGYSDRTRGHRDGCEASSTGCRQGGRCPSLGGLSLQWAGGESSSLPIPVPVTTQGAQAVHPSHGPSPGLGAPLPPGDGWQARGRRLPWQPRHPQGNWEACTRVWARHASPAPSPVLGAGASGAA